MWNSFCTFLVTDGVLAGNPMSGVTRPRTAKRTPRPLRGDDTPERLLTALADGARQARDPWPERDLAVIVTLLVTGIRSSELLDLTVGDIAGPPGERRLLVTGKGDKQRKVPIEPSLEAVIEAYQTSRQRRFPTRGGRLPSRAPLFTGRDGTWMTRSALQVAAFRGRFRQLAQATGGRTARAGRGGRACHGGWRRRCLGGSRQLVVVAALPADYPLAAADGGRRPTISRLSSRGSSRPSPSSPAPCCGRLSAPRCAAPSPWSAHRRRLSAPHRPTSSA